MIIAELDKLHPPKDKKLVIPKRILPFRFKTFQSEASSQWTSIGKSLTNRYQKFQEEDSKNAIEKEFISPRMSQLPRYNYNVSIAVDKRQLTPRFEIKRKYLSFNPEKLQRRSITQLKTQYPATQSEHKISLNCSLMFERNKETLRKQTHPSNSEFTGTYFIPKNQNPSQKLKYVMYKKRKRKNITNPELQVKTKCKAKKINIDEIKKTKFQTLIDGASARKHKSLEKEEKHYFRPWSSKQEQL